jgi:hypothetical protein
MERDAQGQVRDSERVIGVDRVDQFEQQWTKAREAVDPNGRVLPPSSSLGLGSGQQSGTGQIDSGEQQKQLQQ